MFWSNYDYQFIFEQLAEVAEVELEFLGESTDK